MNRIFLLTRALAKAIAHGPFTSPPVNPTRVVVVQLQKLGDMVCTTPVFRALKLSYPNSHLTVVGFSGVKPVLNGNKDVDLFIEWSSPEALLKEIIKGKYDVAILVGPHFLALATLILSGIKTIIAPKIVSGYCPWETRGYRLLRQFVITKQHRMNHYAPREYLNLLEPLGIVREDTTKHMFFSDTDEQKVLELLGDLKGPFVGITPTAGNKIKEWDTKRFAEVADYLIQDKKRIVVLCGGPQDTHRGEEMLAHMQFKDQIVDTIGKLSIGELTALISKMELFIGVDTGPIYIAEALGIKTVDIIGPMSEVEQPPTGDEHKLVYLKDRIAPALHIMNSRMYNAKEAKRQVDSITTPMVIEAIDTLIS